MIMMLISICMISNVNAHADYEFKDSPNNSTVFGTMNDLSIPIEKQTQLLEKINAGKILDCDNPLFNNMKPSSVGWDNYGNYTEQYNYPDGSAKRIEISGGQLLRSTVPASISGGSYQSSTYWYAWTGAKVSYSTVNLSAYFYADFQGTHDSGKITNVYDNTFYAIGITVSSESLTINRANADSYNPAYAKYQFVKTNSGFSSTCRLRLFVPKGSSAYANFFTA